MTAYKNCTPNELDYTVVKGGKTTISVNGKDIVLTFEDIPAPLNTWILKYFLFLSMYWLQS